MAAQTKSNALRAAGQPTFANYPTEQKQCRRPLSTSTFTLSFNSYDIRASSSASLSSTSSSPTMSSSSSMLELERTTTSELAERDYFNENPAPKFLEAHSALARAFIDHHAAASRRVVLIT